MTRIVIAGGPRTGKTTLSNEMMVQHRVPVIHSDDFIDMGWSEASAHMAKLMNETPDPWVVEGVATVRALRKALDLNSHKPCDELVWMNTPHEELTKGQAAMTKGCETVLNEIKPELIKRGVKIVTV